MPTTLAEDSVSVRLPSFTDSSGSASFLDLVAASSMLPRVSRSGARNVTPADRTGRAGCYGAALILEGAAIVGFGGVDIVFEAAVGIMTFVFAPSNHYAELSVCSRRESAFGLGNKNTRLTLW